MLPAKAGGPNVDEMPATIFQAAVPEPYRIFGLRLLPLSLGRYRLLKRFEVAFVAEGEATASMEDLLLGVLICSMRCEEFKAGVERGEWSVEAELRKWGKHIRKEIRRDKHFNLFEKFGLFKAYLDAGSEMPRFLDEQPDRPTSGAHWSHSVEVTLRSELGYTTEDIEEGSLSKALADYFRWAEGQGLVRLVTKEQELEMEREAEANRVAFEACMERARAEGLLT